VTLLEYGDFECPQCAQAYPIVKELERRFGDRLRFVFRHFPLTNVHPNAQRAAEAAEWAASLGLFWEMHDAIYQRSGELSEARLLEIASALASSRTGLLDAWHAHTYFAHVKEDFRSGIASGARGTPTFFIDSIRHDGAWDLESLASAIAQRSG